MAINALVYSPGDQHLASGGAAGVLVLHSPISGYGLADVARHVIDTRFEPLFPELNGIL